MNAFVAVLPILLFFLSSTDGKPTGSIIRETIDDIKTNVWDAVDKMKAIAEKDNPDTAAKLIPKISEGINMATEFIETSLADLEPRQITADEGKKLISDLKKLVMGMQGQAQEDLQKLTKDARNEIHITFLMSFGNTVAKLKELLAVLIKKN